jgi:pyruvate-formate lyase-activating enzyme
MHGTIVEMDSQVLRSPRQRDIEVAPDLLVADPEGRLFEVPEMAMAGRSGTRFGLPQPEDLIPMPPGSDLFAVPDRDPVGFQRKTGGLVRLTEYRGIPVRAVALFMAPAHTATWWSAYVKRPKANILPLFAYTALGWRDGFVAAAFRVDPDLRQDLAQFPDDAEMENRGKRILEKNPTNSLIHHVVANCALTYRCPAARNYVLGRWEAPLPLSPGCNAACVGCISEPPEEHEIPPTQPRLTAQPTPKEIAEMAIAHLESAERPVVSFGQGCEGEPLLRWDAMEEAIRLIRKRTSRGVINLNTNASISDAIERLAAAGLDSIRVSTNSARKDIYERYYQPRSYTFEDVVVSTEIMRRFKKWISLNYFIFPGLTDHPDEVSAFLELCRRTRPNIIQMRNLNIDPDVYADLVGLKEETGDGMGVRGWMESVRRELPGIGFGYFNPPKESWGASWGDGFQ